MSSALVTETDCEVLAGVFRDDAEQGHHPFETEQEEQQLSNLPTVQEIREDALPQDLRGNGHSAAQKAVDGDCSVARRARTLTQ